LQYANDNALLLAKVSENTIFNLVWMSFCTTFTEC